MTYKQIETSREIRLWIGTIIVPAVTTVVTLMSIPEVRNNVLGKVDNIKESMSNKFKKR